MKEWLQTHFHDPEPGNSVALSCQILVVGLVMMEDIESQMRPHLLQVGSNQGITMRVML